MAFDSRFVTISFEWVKNKLRQITRPRQKKLADSENICVWTYEKGPRVIWLDLELNTAILDEYDDYKSSRAKLFVFYTIYGS